MYNILGVKNSALRIEGSNDQYIDFGYYYGHCLQDIGKLLRTLGRNK